MKVNCKGLAHIIPAEQNLTGANRTMGTQVFVDGVKLEGVTGITLHCEQNDVWRAEIRCLVVPPEVRALPFVEADREGWLSRLCRWIAGEPRDVTHTDSAAMEWRR